jgi:predicted urease superfamily metal-dependent hydrolase
MKKSEAYRQRAQEADHVLAALGLHTKAVREERKERFEEKWLPLLLEKEVVVTHFANPQNKYEICFMENGTEEVVDYFPKVNKILIRKSNKWIKPGLRWIVKKFKLYE